MPIQTIVDIESLPHSVRDIDSRRLIDDAIAAYYSGALRSSIVSTWTAVVFDIISKIHEIEPPTNYTALKFIKDLKAAITESHKTNKHHRMLSIEEDILEAAQKKFQFINSHEHDILDRIREDRHRCAHPAFISNNKVFHPSPDLARSHIVHALQIVLTRPPIQGMSDINRFSEDILGVSFPSNEQDVKEYIYSKYVDGRLEPFIENLIEKILEVPFSEGENELSDKTNILAWSLSAISEKRKELFIMKIQSFIGQKEHAPAGKNLLKLCPFLGVSSHIWSCLKSQIQINLVELIKKCTTDDIIEYYVLDALSVERVEACLTEKVNSMSVDIKVDLISRYPHEYFVPFAINMLEESKSDEEGSQIGMSAVIPLSLYLDANDIILIHKAIKENFVLNQSYYTLHILETLFDSTKNLLPQTKDSWRDIVENCNPEIYQSIGAKLKAEGL